MASWQPCLAVGDLNVEPASFPSLQKGIMAQHSFGLPASWAAAAGLDPTFKQVLVPVVDLGRILFLDACFRIILCVLLVGWVGGQLGFVSLFGTMSFSLLPGFLLLKRLVVPSLPRFGVSGDECLQVVHSSFWEGVRSALLAGDVSLAWNVRSSSAEVSLYLSWWAFACFWCSDWSWFGAV